MIIAQIGITSHIFGQSLLEHIHGIELIWIHKKGQNCVKTEKREFEREVQTVNTFTPPHANYFD